MDLLFAYLRATDQTDVLMAHIEYSNGRFQDASQHLQHFRAASCPAHQPDSVGFLFADIISACVSMLEDNFTAADKYMFSAMIQLETVRDKFPLVREVAHSAEYISDLTKERVEENENRSKLAREYEKAHPPSTSGSGGGGNKKSGAASASAVVQQVLPLELDPNTTPLIVCPYDQQTTTKREDIHNSLHGKAFTHYSKRSFQKMTAPLLLCLEWLKDYRSLYGVDQHHKLMASCEIVRNGAKFSYDRQLVGCIGVNVPVITWLRGVLHNCLSTVNGMVTDPRYVRQKNIYDDIYRTATKFPSPGGATLPFVGSIAGSIAGGSQAADDNKNDATSTTLSQLELLAYFQLPWPMALVPAGRLPYIVVLLQALSKLVQAELLLSVFKDNSCLTIALEVFKMSENLEKKVNGAEPELSDLFSTIKQQVVAMAIMSGTHHRPTFDQNYPELSRLVAKTPLTNADAVPVEALQRLAEETLLSAYDAYSQAMHFDTFKETHFLAKKYRLLSTVVERCKSGLKLQMQANFKYQKLTIEDTDGRFASKLHCMKGFALYHLGERLGALIAFRTGIRFHPYCFEALNQLTHLYLTPAPPMRTHICTNTKCKECKDYVQVLADEIAAAETDDSWSCGMFPWEEFETTRLRFAPGSDEHTKLTQQLHVLRMHRRRLQFCQTTAAMNETPLSIFEFAAAHRTGPPGGEPAGAELEYREESQIAGAWEQETKLLDIEKLMLPAIKKSDEEFEKDQEARQQIVALVTESEKTKKKFDSDLSMTKDRCNSKEKELTKLREQRKKLLGKASVAREAELNKVTKELQSLSSKEKRARQKSNDLLKNQNIHQNKLESTVEDLNATLVKLQSQADDADDEFLQWEKDTEAEFAALEEALKKPPPPRPPTPPPPPPTAAKPKKQASAVAAKGPTAKQLQRQQRAAAAPSAILAPGMPLPTGDGGVGAGAGGNPKPASKKQLPPQQQSAVSSTSSPAGGGGAVNGTAAPIVAAAADGSGGKQKQLPKKALGPAGKKK